MKSFHLKEIIYGMLFCVSALIGGNAFAQNECQENFVFSGTGNRQLTYTDCDGYVYYFFIEPNGELTLTNSGFTRVKGTASENSYKGILIIPSEVTLPANNPYNNNPQEETFKVTTIGTRAAYHCVGDAPDYPEKKRSEYDAYLQNVDGTNELISVIIPPTVTEIGAAAFSDCFALSRIKGMENVTKIGNLAFCKTAITTLNFSNNLEDIGEEIFWYCINLTDITIPSSVIKMGKQTFGHATSLQSVYIEAKFPAGGMPSNMFVGVNPVPTLYVPYDAGEEYEKWVEQYNKANEKNPITLVRNIPEVITGEWRYNGEYLRENRMKFPEEIIIKEGGSICVENGDYDKLGASLNGTTIKLEKELPTGEYSLIGNIGETSNYSFVDENAGNVSAKAHGIIALPFFYANNNWGINANGQGALATNSSVSVSESFFIYPTNYDNVEGPEDNNGNGKNIIGDTYTILTQNITSSNIKLSNLSNSLSNTNTTKWFALSNPFIGRLNLNKFFTTNSAALNSSMAYVWDNEVTHDWVELDVQNCSTAILPATGFMVEGAVDNPTFHFNLDDIVTVDDDIDITKSSPIANKIEFVVRNKGIAKRMYAHINDFSSNGFGKMDASVLLSSKENAVNPYMKVDGHNLIDNYFSQLPATFDLNFNAYKDHTISFALTKTMQDIEITLIDVENNNAEIVLNVDEPISIDVTEGQNEGKYQLRFSKKNVGIDELASEESTINIWNTRNIVNISGKELKKVEIYNTLGQVVYSSNLAGSSTSINTNLKDGAYIVKVQDTKTSKSEKIIIK